MIAPTQVYFIKPAGMDGPIKIGCSSVPTGRLLDLGVWSPFPLELIGAVPGEFADERFLHQCFADVHSHREWFRSSPELHAAIAAILAAGSVNVVRGKIEPKGPIRNQIGHKRSEEQKRYQSYNFRVIWACKKLRVDREDKFVYFTAPGHVRQIIDRWGGNAYQGVPGVPPTRDELASIEEFLANPALYGIPHQSKRIGERAA